MDVRAADAPAAQLPAHLSFVLNELQVYNWGAFEGHHSADIDIEGTAIIGATASGKTTLIDALMTLLTANPRYNLASTGGHESDRDLVSYCRGVSGAGNNSGDNEHIARPGKAISGISARFSNGSQQLSIAALFWFEDSSSSASDLQRLWIFSEAEGQSLLQWLDLKQREGLRTLKQLARETPHLRMTPNKQEYLAHLRRFFEVGENAFALLNRAAGLKQLDSIDEIFRELVLDDTSTFDRAAEVANEFDNLTAIHKELEIARQQLQSLKPIANLWQQREAHTANLRIQEALWRAVPLWYAHHALRLWRERELALAQGIAERVEQLNSLRQRIKTLVLESEELRDQYMRAGGANIDSLRAQAKLQEGVLEFRRRHASEYRRVVGLLKMTADLSARALTENQSAALLAMDGLSKDLEEQKQAARRCGAASQRDEESVGTLLQEHEQVARRTGSNIRAEYQQFRAELADHLDLNDSALPFVAELVEVKREESAWRGAIERALGGQRLRVLVPPASLQRALSWINGRDNRLHVRLLEAIEPAGMPTFFSDGFLRKLKFKPHPYANVLKHLLVGLDRHCVDSTEELHRTPHGMTPQGLMSGKQGFFEKQDSKPLNQDWMTGFDNKDRLAELSDQISAARTALAQSQRLHQAAEARVALSQQRHLFLDSLSGVHFEDIDVPSAEAALRDLTARLQALLDPKGDAQTAHELWQGAQIRLDQIGHEERAVDLARGKLENEREVALERAATAQHRLGLGLSDADRDLASKHLTTPESSDLKDLADLERAASQSVNGNIEGVRGQIAQSETELVRAMERARKADTGALTEAGTEIFDVPAYLERLRVLTEEALPEKLQRFLAYLNQSSDQGVTQLLTDINNEVSVIEERVEDLNKTLRRVDFTPERYLRLEPQRIVHESLKALQLAQRQLRSAQLKDDAGESHFKALENMVALLRDASERRKTVSARALLDPRYRLQFAVSTIRRDTGAVIETRTGSQGGSGGEKESIASYVLTASLSYALCPQDGDGPLFATIVLDEAFSRSSHAVASGIIRALHEFGLHPLFVTPYKELRLLRQHTRSAVLIHRKGARATMTSLDWEQIEAHARERDPKTP
jgi:uncharacterized protein YPO0396